MENDTYDFGTMNSPLKNSPFLATDYRIGSWDQLNANLRTCQGTPLAGFPTYPYPYHPYYLSAPYQSYFSLSRYLRSQLTMGPYSMLDQPYCYCDSKTGCSSIFGKQTRPSSSSRIAKRVTIILASTRGPRNAGKQDRTEGRDVR